MNATSFIGQKLTIHIDRPLGSRHPQWGYLYPINYGYLPNTPAPDGEDLDAYVLGVDIPLEIFTGVCVAVIHRLDDEDDKLILVPPNFHPSNDEILEVVAFQEQFFSIKLQRV